MKNDTRGFVLGVIFEMRLGDGVRVSFSEYSENETLT